MGKSKEDFEEVREFCMVEMSREFYESHEEFFKGGECKLKSAFTKGRAPKNDPVYTEKMERFMVAHDELRQHEFLMNYKRIINLD